MRAKAPGPAGGRQSATSLGSPQFRLGRIYELLKRIEGPEGRARAGNSKSANRLMATQGFFGTTNGIFKPMCFNGGSSAATRSRAMAMSASASGIDPATALQVRRAIYSHDPLTRADMDLVFATARKAGPAPCAEWVSLFCEAVTDYVVHQNEPADYIPAAKVDWLVQTLTENGGIASRAEFDMLIDVMTHALGVPTSLSGFALREIETAITQGRRGAITGEDHAAGVVTKADVEALRAVLYAAKTGTAEHVTREEAEALFDIAHAAKQVDPAFNDLFARAVGNYLMAINAHVPDAAEALHFDKWLDEKDTLPGFLSRMLMG